MLTDAQVNLPGPLQLVGSVDKLPEIPNPVMALPSLEVNVTLIVCLVPTTTETIPATEGVATTELLVPVIPLPPPIGLPVGLPLVFPVPLIEISEPLLVP